MTDERTRGVLLYTLTGVVLAAGGFWFVRADPTRADPRFEKWQETAAQALPDVDGQFMGESVELRPERSVEVSRPVDGGSYTLTLVCAGTGRARVRLSSSGAESGRGVPCAENAPVPEVIRVGLGEEFFLSVTAEGGSGVFRWRLERNRAF